MEHLKLLLRFMNYPQNEVNIISQPGVDLSALPIIATNPLSSVFISDFGGIVEGKNQPNRLVGSTRTPSPELPQLSQLPIYQTCPQYTFLRSEIFRRGFSNDCRTGNDVLVSTSDQNMDEVVKDEVKVSQSFDSMIITTKEVAKRFQRLPLNNAVIKVEPSKFKSSNSFLGHQLMPNSCGKNETIILQPTPKNLMEKDAKCGGLPRLDFVQRVCSTKIKVESKPYTCNICKRKYKQKCHMYRHQRQHSGVKRFFCMFCNRGFYQLSNLKNHRRTHSNDSSISHPYACTLCTRRFTRNMGLIRHIERHRMGLIK